jgi:hypothetical protein
MTPVGIYPFNPQEINLLFHTDNHTTSSANSRYCIYSVYHSIKLEDILLITNNFDQNFGQIYTYYKNRTQMSLLLYRGQNLQFNYSEVLMKLCQFLRHLSTVLFFFIISSY